jgi:phospholipid/cholesterol/gamma-HCH transport system substrate-binding protein
MEALKHNFFFRGFFNDRGYFNLTDISPAEYRQGVLTKEGARGVTRVWLGAPMLFETDPALPESERLTDEGKRRLDSAVEPYLAHLGDTVLMVEGYSQQGVSSEQFRRSRARAALARNYLIGAYQFNPQTIGVMPLGSESVDSPDNRSWDGIALAVFLDRESLAKHRK